MAGGASLRGRGIEIKQLENWIPGFSAIGIFESFKILSFNSAG